MIAELRRRLKDLHGELEHAENVSPEDADLLRTLMTDIVTLLDRSKQGNDEPYEDRTFSEDLMDMTYRFETSHPTLASSIRHVAVALGNMGL